MHQTGGQGVKLDEQGGGSTELFDDGRCIRIYGKAFQVHIAATPASVTRSGAGMHGGLTWAAYPPPQTLQQPSSLDATEVSIMYLPPGELAGAQRHASCLLSLSPLRVFGVVGSWKRSDNYSALDQLPHHLSVAVLTWHGLSLLSLLFTQELKCIRAAAACFPGRGVSKFRSTSFISWGLQIPPRFLLRWGT